VFASALGYAAEADLLQANPLAESRTEDAARLAARIWTITATAEMAGLNFLTYLTAYLDACGLNGGKPLTSPEPDTLPPWNAAPPT
jgi:transposase